MDWWDGGHVRKISQQLGKSSASPFPALEEGKRGGGGDGDGDWRLKEGLEFHIKSPGVIV